MRSHDLASLAHVTVRTLRHYHQVGVLPEPPRGSNGYRDYSVHDLIRLLRIRRLAAIGIPLERMAGVLDSGQEEQGELLDQLDADLDAQIASLQGQKALIRLIRAQESALDLPPELARFVAMFAGSGLSESMARMDREQAILLTHLAGDDGNRQLVEMYERMTEPPTRELLIQLARDFDALGAEATDEQVAEVVAHGLRVIGPLSHELSPPDAVPLVDERQLAHLLSDYQRGTFTGPQQRAFAELIERLSA